jgi:hypothetical protein
MAWTAWQQSKAYNCRPSEYYGIEGAAGLYLDNGVYLFGTYVEQHVQEAGEGARNEMFARSSREREFARLMGEDMSKSTAGYADPFSTGAVKVKEGSDGDLLWSES